MKNSTYKGQALAIIMVVLVVSSIIGLSIFTRSIRDKRATIQERDSAEAYEIVDSILNNMLSHSIEDWEEAGMVKGVVYREKDGVEEITDKLRNLQSYLALQSTTICPLKGTNNEYTLCLNDTNSDTVFDVEPGHAFTFVVGEENINPGCIIGVNFVGNQSNNTGFMINYINNDAGNNIKEYDYSDAKTYCFKIGEKDECNDFRKYEGVTKFDPSDTLEVPINPGVNRIQLIAINERIRLRYTPVNCPANMFDRFSLKASATCNNVYRAKEVLLPKIKSNYSLFNYVIFNGIGSMLTSQ